MSRVDADSVEVTRELGRCSECADWLGKVRAQQTSLRELPRRAAPPELDARVRTLFAPDSTSDSPSDDLGAPNQLGARAVAAVRALPRQPAPVSLEDRVERELAPRSVRAVALLDAPPAPDVLRRLVSEELANPEGQLSRRFAGDLPAQSAPAGLWQRVFESQTTRRGRRWTSVAALAAAVLFTWTLTRSQPTEEWSFTVVRVDSARTLDPMARALASGLTGGLAGSEQLPTPTTPGGARSR